jgi:hypothetical protein
MAAESQPSSSSLRPADASQQPRWLRKGPFATPPVVVGLLLITAVVFGVANWTAEASESSLGRHLQSHGAHSVGTVTATEPSNHNYISYSYRVHGVEYSSDTSSFVSADALEADQVHVGQRIPVTYDSEEPSLSCSCDVGELAGSRLSGTLPFLVAAPLLLGLMIVLLVRRNRQSKSSV